MIMSLINPQIMSTITTYLKSPIGKILVENDNILSSNHQNHFIDISSQPVMNSPVDEMTKTSSSYYYYYYFVSYV